MKTAVPELMCREEEIESDETEGNVRALVCINMGILLSVCRLWQSAVVWWCVWKGR
jgi:hypothetical protein